jgi:20S proteasome subunit beta 2
MGSGSLAAMSVFETQWRRAMTRDEAVKLCADAILAGIFNDLGSGSNVDVCVITPDKATLLRNYIKPNERERKRRDYRFKKGTTAVLNEKVVPRADLSKYVTVHELQDDSVEAAAEKMDVDT